MKRKGFTLIELLAVIVILAILTVIAVPKMLDVIENSRRKAWGESAGLMAKAAELKYSEASLINEEKDEKYIFENGDFKSDSPILTFKGDKPYSGIIVLEKGKTTLALINPSRKYCAIKNEGERIAKVYKIGDEITEEECVIGYTGEKDDDEEKIKDEKECELEQEIKDGKEYYYVDSVCDMYALSKEVNDGNNYSGKIVKLRNNLDMSKIDNSTKKYIEENKEYFTEEDLKINERFMPIGTNVNPFKGTFEGNAKTISNLTIENDENTGLFGYNKGTIKGLTLKNIKITGKTTVGGLVGYNQGTISDIIISGKVEGETNVGGVAGQISGNSSVVSNIIIKDINVTGDTNVGGLVGLTNSGYIRNIIIEKVNSSGYAFTGDNGVFPQNTSMISNSSENKVNSTSTNEVTFNENVIGDINAYETFIDTYIGGDNDKSGYYFDYNNKGEIVIKSTQQNPIEFNLSGTGTEDDPYLISNYEEWKMATTKLDKVFKLTSDIDFSNKKFYMLGSNYIKDTNYNVNSYPNRFKGHLIGDMHTLKGITMKGGYYQGLIGYGEGATIEGLNIDNFNVESGNNNIGTIAGYITGTVKGINLSNINIKGNNNVGGLFGATSKILATTVAINANVIGNENVGGIIGLQSNSASDITYMILNVNVNGSVDGNIGGVIGNNSANVTEYIILESGTINTGNLFTGYGGYGSKMYYTEAVTIPDTDKQSKKGDVSKLLTNNSNFDYYDNDIGINENNNSGYKFSLINEKIKVIKSN